MIELAMLKNQSYTTSIQIPFPPEVVFDHIKDVPRWWTEDFEGYNNKLNDEFVICHPGAHYSKQRVTEMIPGKKIVWLVTESELTWLQNKEEWTGTSMIFELVPDGDKTTLSFSHEGLVPGLECYDRCSQGWNIVIKNRLFNFITHYKMANQNNVAKYTVAIEVERSPADVFNHIVNDIPKYWPEDFEGECAKLNDEFVFRSEGGHYSKNLVTEFVPGKKVVWLVTESIRPTDNFDWTGTKMTFELKPKGNNTVVEFTYDGVVLENEQERLVQICDFVIEESLYNFLTKGR